MVVGEMISVSFVELVCTSSSSIVFRIAVDAAFGPGDGGGGGGR